MTEHVHEWKLQQEWSRFCDDPADFDGYSIVCCNCGIKEHITEDEINSRLNATERLSAEMAVALADDFYPCTIWEEALRAYADMLAR